MCDRMLPPFAVALDMPQDFFAPFFANEAHINLRFLHYPPQEDTSENTFGTAPAHRQQLHDRAGAHRRAGSGDPPAVRRVVAAAGHSRHVPDQSRQHDAPLVERPLPVHAARRDQRVRAPTAIRSPISTARTRTATIECLPSCVSADNPPRYAPAVYRDLVLEFYRENYFHQRGHKSEAATLAAAE